MARPPSPSDASPLLDHLTTLYPFACLLVGSDEAPQLLLRVYQKAAEHPPTERPDDLEGWLLGLLRDTSAGPAFVKGETASALEDRSSDDPLRRDVAEQLLENVLPIALAACSPQEQFLLAVDATGLNEALLSDEEPDTTVEEARASLWGTLQDVLSEPEFALVDESMSDAALQEAVRDWVAAHFSPTPSSLRTRIRAHLDATQRSEAPSSEDKTSASPEASSSLLDRLPSRPKPRALFILLIGAVVLVGGLGVAYLTQPSPPPAPSSTSLITFSAERAGEVTPDLTTSNRSEAEAYVESTWNRQTRLPEIERTRLRGIGRVRASGAEIPVLLYADTADSTRIATFVYNYALIDQLADTATLDSRTREALAQRKHLVAEEQESEAGILWRERADIFVTVAPSIPADSLRTRLRP